MDNSTLTIIGLIVTVLFGILSIWLTIWMVRRKKRPCEIIFLATDCINLYNKLTLGFDSLELRANKKEVKNDLLFFSGVFVSNGLSDIKSLSNIIRMQLPPKCKWSDLQVSSQSEGVQASISIIPDKPESANLVFDQFRMKEFIAIKGLIECQDQELLQSIYEFHKSIKYTHRIVDTDPVLKSEFSRNHTGLFPFFLHQIPFIIMLVMILVSMFKVKNLNPINYLNVKNHSEYYAMVLSNGNVMVHEPGWFNELFGMNKKEISLQEFKANYQIIGEYKTISPIVIIDYVMFGIMVLIISIFLVRRIRYYFHTRRLTQLYLCDN